MGPITSFTENDLGSAPAIHNVLRSYGYRILQQVAGIVVSWSTVARPRIGLMGWVALAVPFDGIDQPVQVEVSQASRGQGGRLQAIGR
jgi:hypothetical protein